MAMSDDEMDVRAEVPVERMKSKKKYTPDSDDDDDVDNNVKSNRDDSEDDRASDVSEEKAANEDVEEGDEDDDEESNALSAGKNDKFPAELDHPMDNEGMLDMRVNNFHIQGGFGHAAKIAPVDEQASDKNSLAIVATKPFLTPPDFATKKSKGDWFKDVQKTNITALKLVGAVRGKIAVEKNGARNKVEVVDRSSKQLVVPMLRSTCPKNETITTVLTPLPAAFIQTLWEFGKSIIKNSATKPTKRQSWEEFIKIIFYDVYGTSDWTKLDNILKDPNNIWVYDTRKGSFEGYLINNKWHRYRPPKVVKTAEEKAAAKASKTSRGVKRARNADKQTEETTDDANHSINPVNSTNPDKSTNATPSAPSSDSVASRKWIEMCGNEFTDEHGHVYRTVLQRLI